MSHDRSWKSATDRMRDRARDLRRTSTIPERRLWNALRAGRIGGVKFRRQHPIGPYIVDFYCHEGRLVVEFDGRSHADRFDADLDRQRHLESLGLHVVRFGNDDVLQNLDGVVEGIARVLGITPSAPSP